MSWTVFDEEGPFAGMSSEEGAKEFLRRNRMRMTICRRKKTAKEHSECQWAFRITKSNGKFLASHYFTGDGARPTPYGILSCLYSDMVTEEEYYKQEIWKPRLKKFFATKKVRDDLMQFT